MNSTDPSPLPLQWLRPLAVQHLFLQAPVELRPHPQPPHLQQRLPVLLLQHTDSVEEPVGPVQRRAPAGLRAKSSMNGIRKWWFLLLLVLVPKGN